MWADQDWIGFKFFESGLTLTEKFYSPLLL